MLHKKHATGRFTEPQRAALRPGDEAGGAQPTQHWRNPSVCEETAPVTIKKTRRDSCRNRCRLGREHFDKNASLQCHVPTCDVSCHARWGKDACMRWISIAQKFLKHLFTNLKIDIIPVNQRFDWNKIAISKKVKYVKWLRRPINPKISQFSMHSFMLLKHREKVQV